MRILGIEQVLAAGRADLEPRLLLQLALTAPGPDALILNLSDRYIAAQTLSVLAAAAILASPDAEAVLNGTFPTDLTGWSTSTVGGGTAAWRDDGTGGSMRLGAISDVNDTSTATQLVSVAQGKPYTFSFRIHSAGVPGGLTVTLGSSNGGAELLTTTPSAAGLYTFSGIVSPTGVIFVKFHVTFQFSNYIDDVSLVGGGNAAVAAQYRDVEIPEHLPLVQSWGTLREALNTFHDGVTPATAEVALLNTLAVGGRARLSDLLRSPLNTGTAYEFAGAQVTVSLWLGVAEPLTLGVFFLEEPTDIGEELFTLRMIGEDGYLERRQPLTRITRAIFARVAAPVLGQVLRRPIGPLKNVPLQPLVDGAATELAVAISGTPTTITLADASLFDDSGSVMIDVEIIAYTGKTGNVLTGLSRAQESTEQEDHAVQARAYQVRTGTNAYRYALEHDGRFLITSLLNIKVNGRAPATSPTTELDATDIATGKHFAAVSFTPANVKDFHTAPLSGVLALSPAALVVSSTGFGLVGAIRTVAINAEAGDTTRTMTYKVTSTAGNFTWNIQRRTVGGAWVIIRSGTHASLPLDDQSDARQYASSAAEEIRLQMDVSATPANITLTFNSYEVTGTGGGTGESTALAVIGEVTADVEGIQDDGAGTISGTANLLLTNPADVYRYLLTQLYGVPAARLGQHWAASRASLAGAAYRWAFLLGHDGPVRLGELQAKAEQARCELFLDAGLWELRFIPDAPAAADLPLDYLKDVWDEMPARVARTEVTQRYNAIVASGQRDYVAGGDRYSKDLADLSQPGFTERTELALACDLVQDPGVIDAIAAWKLGWVKRQRWEVELVTFPDAPAGGEQRALAVQKGDHVTLASHPVLAAHGGPALLFRVKQKAYALDGEYPLGIRLAGVEANG